MESQHCKVGSVTEMTNGPQNIGLLEQQYQNFMDKAYKIKFSDSKLAAFFELKAMKIHKILKNQLQ